MADHDKLLVLPAVHRVVHQVGLALEGVGEPPVTQAEALLLARLLESEATVGQLHAAFAHKRSTLTSILDRLVDRGLAVREPSPADRRTSVLRLTRSGQAAARLVHDRLREIESRLRQTAGASATRTFRQVLATLEEILADPSVSS